MKIIFLYFLVALLLGCHSGAQEKQDDIAVARSETPAEKKNTKVSLPVYLSEIGKEGSKYNVFYVFDNGCSFCISKFVEVVNDFQTLQGSSFNKTRYFFIAIDKDTSKIRYYLNKYNIKLSSNQYLFPDKNNEFVTLNPAITGKNEVNYLLTDSAYYPITLGDPFYDFNIRDIYDSLNILKSHKVESM